MAKALPLSAQSEPRVQLRWPSDAACPPPAAAEAEIARLLGKRYAELPPTTFRVELRTLGDGYELALHFSDADLDEAQRVSLHTCAEVHEAAVLLAAMSLGPTAPPAPEPQPPEPEPEPEPARKTYPLVLRLDLAAVLDTSSLPGVSAGPALGVSLTYGPWLAAIGGRFLAPRDASHNLPEGVRAPIDLFAGALTLGYRAALRRLQIGPLAELELGYLRGRSEGTEEAVAAGALWAALWAGVALSSRWDELVSSPSPSALSRLELSLSCLLGAPLSRPRFSLADEAHFYTTAAVGFRAFVAVSIALGPTE